MSDREQRPGEGIIGVVLRARWALLGLVLVVSALAVVGMAGVGVDNAVEVWFVDDDPSLVAYRDFQETFGNDEVAVIGVFGDDPLGPDGLARLRAVGDAAAAIDGVAEADSVITLPVVRGGEGLLEVGPVVGPGPLAEHDAAAIAADVRDDPTLRSLVAEEGGVALVLARMEAMHDIDARRDGILGTLRQDVAATGADVAYAGIGVIYSALNEASTQGAALFIGASYLLIALLLWKLYGRLGPLVLTLFVVGLGSTWVLGLYGGMGRDINMVTMVMPTLVLVIGVSDCVHMLSHVAAQDPSLPRWERVRRGIGFVLWPCLFNTLTTSMGFVALTTSHMRVVRDLGFFSAAGLVGAFLLALVLCTTALLSARFEPARAETGLVQRFVDALAGWAVERHRGVLIGSAVIGLVSALGITRIVADTWSIDFLRAGHPVRVDSDRIERAYGAYTPLEFVVRSPSGVRDVDTMMAVAHWQDRVEAELACPEPGVPLPDGPCVAWSRSAADVVRRLNQVLGGTGGYAVPPDPAAFDQLLFLYESDADGDLDSFVSADDTRARVTMGIPMDSAQGFGAAIDAISARAELPEGVSVEAAGYLPLYVRMMDYIVASQLTSFGLAFLVIFTLLGLLFRSLRMVALAVPANLLPVLFTLGIMGLAGIRLDVATVTIAAIVLGLVVDDTVQFLYRYRHEQALTDDVRVAVRATVRSVGRPIAITTIVLGLGLLVLGLAAVKSVAWFGLLLAVALFSALLSDLLVVPALLVALSRR